MDKNFKFALLGHQIDYSLSPKIHEICFDEWGIKASYELVSASALELPKIIKEMSLHYDGFNVTKPHKNAITSFLTTKTGKMDAVNTVKVEKGKLHGYNTDLYGFMRHFNAECSMNIRGKDALVLGAGGVAEPVVYALVQCGANVKVFNRTLSRAEALCACRGGTAIKNMDGFLPEIVVNCTTAGLSGEQALPHGLNLQKLKFAYDTIYTIKTPFIQACIGAGAKVSDGLGMLIWQAIKAEEIWLDIKLDAAKEEALFQKIHNAISE